MLHYNLVDIVLSPAFSVSLQTGPTTVSEKKRDDIRASQGAEGMWVGNQLGKSIYINLILDLEVKVKVIGLKMHI